MAADLPEIELPTCPQCGSSETVPILYDCPTAETFEAVERGEIPWAGIGGCVADDANPVWGCPTGRHRW